MFAEHAGVYQLARAEAVEVGSPLGNGQPVPQWNQIAGGRADVEEYDMASRQAAGERGEGQPVRSRAGEWVGTGPARSTKVPSVPSQTNAGFVSLTDECDTVENLEHAFAPGRGAVRTARRSW